MKINRHICAIVSSALLLAALQGCVERKLKIPDPAGEVVIQVDWSPEALVPPDGAMDYRFYREDGTPYETFEGVTGTFRQVFPEGNYRVLITNSDAERIGYRSVEQYETAALFAEEKEIHDDDVHWNILGQPYRVFGTGNLEGGRLIEVKNKAVTEKNARLNDLVRRVHLRVSFTGHSSTVTEVTGRLKGVSPSVILESEQYLHEGSNLVEFRTVKLEQPDRFRSTVYVFDLHTQTFTGRSTIELEVTSSRYGTLSETADLNSLIEQLRQENGGKLPPNIYIDLTVEYTPLGIGEIEVETWEAGEEEDIEIEF